MELAIHKNENRLTLKKASVTIPREIGNDNCTHESGGDWVPGSGGRRTAPGPEGSSAKA